MTDTNSSIRFLGLSFTSWVIIIIAAIVIICMKTCGGSAADKYQPQITSLKDRAVRLQDSLISLNIRYDTLKEDLQNEYSSRSHIEDSQANVIKATQSRAKELADRIAIHALDGHENLQVFNYTDTLKKLTDCDTLAALVIQQGGQLKFYKLNEDEKDKVVGQEITLRDNHITELGHLLDSCGSINAAYNLLTTKMAKDLKGRNQIYLGGELIGSPQSLFTNVGGVIGLLTKKGKLYEMSSGIQSSGGYYISVKALFKIKL